jgi:predicted nuclease of predicted toxin-antitoxin system
MIRFLADENFNSRILRGVRREIPDIDVVRVQDTVMYQSPDPAVLEWASEEQRIVLTHDAETMVGYANERIAAGLPMPGVILVRNTLPIGQVVADLLVIAGASEMHDWENRVIFLPL